VNISQLLSSNNRLRKSLRDTLLVDEPVLQSTSHFDNLFKHVEASTNSIFSSLKKQDDSGRSLAEKLAQTLDQDQKRKTLDQDHLFHSLHNYGNNPDFDGLELGASNAQEVLGSLFETLDILIQSQDDLDSHLGDSDRQVDLNLKRLSGLVDKFDSMISMILEKVSDATFNTLTQVVSSARNLLYTDPSASFESVDRQQKIFVK
jgi:hypothetical protein